MPIILKLYRCFGPALKMCICLEYYLQIKFCYFFSQVEFSRFLGIYMYYYHNVTRSDTGYLVCATPPTTLLFVAVFLGC